MFGHIGVEPCLVPVGQRINFQAAIFDLETGKPTILVLGGGTGSLALNRAFEQVADTVAAEFNVLHATGRGKGIFADRRAPAGYYVTELFVDDFGMALCLADVVVTRAGVGTLLDLVREKKAAIFVPLPNSSQVANARAVEEAHAGIVLPEDRLEQDLVTMLREAIEPHRKQKLEERIGELFPKDGAEKIVELIRQKNTSG